MLKQEISAKTNLINNKIVLKLYIYKHFGIMKISLVLIFLIGCWTTPGLAQKARNVTQAIHFIKLANTLRELNKSPESIDLLERALPTVRQNDTYWTAVAYELLGLSFKDQGDSVKALYHLEIARSRYHKLKYVASAWAVNELVRDISGKNFYAGIQVGDSDVKLAIFKTKYETDFYEKEIKTTFNIPNTILVADASKKSGPGPDAIKVCLDSIQHYNIPGERVFIAFSTELSRTPENRKRLYERLLRELPNINFKIDTTLTDKREAELFTAGTIPRKVWPNTSALAISNESTVGGYFDLEPSSRKKTFHALTLPFGINTLVSQIENKRSLNGEAYKKEAQRVINGILETTLSSKLNDPGLDQRKIIGLGGDITLALMAYLHPEKAGISAIPISLKEIELFKSKVLSDYNELIRPNLNDIADPVVRQKAESDINTSRSRLSEKQLIAGALWLDAIMKRYSNTAATKRFVFVRNSDIGWVTGKFIETISGEYESTIAKGSLYTR
ncbi:hypothetical protein GCM10027299_03020 [Larkinella ripae]